MAEIGVYDLPHISLKVTKKIYFSLQQHWAWPKAFTRLEQLFMVCFSSLDHASIVLQGNCWKCLWFLSRCIKLDSCTLREISCTWISFLFRLQRSTSCCRKDNITVRVYLDEFASAFHCWELCVVGLLQSNAKQMSPNCCTSCHRKSPFLCFEAASARVHRSLRFLRSPSETLKRSVNKTWKKYSWASSLPLRTTEPSFHVSLDFANMKIDLACGWMAGTVGFVILLCDNRKWCVVPCTKYSA